SLGRRTTDGLQLLDQPRRLPGAFHHPYTRSQPHRGNGPPIGRALEGAYRLELARWNGNHFTGCFGVGGIGGRGGFGLPRGSAGRFGIRLGSGSRSALGRRRGLLVDENGGWRDGEEAAGGEIRVELAAEAKDPGVLGELLEYRRRQLLARGGTGHPV